MVKALDMESSDGSECPRIESGQSQKRFIMSQVRVGLGILTDLNWHLPSNVAIKTTHPLNKRGNAYGTLLFIKSQVRVGLGILTDLNLHPVMLPS